MFSINLKRSVVTVGVVAGLLVTAGPASAQGGGADFARLASPGLAHEGVLGPIDEMDLSVRGDDTITQAREPAQTVTMLDYMGSP